MMMNKSVTHFTHLTHAKTNSIHESNKNIIILKVNIKHTCQVSMSKVSKVSNSNSYNLININVDKLQKSLPFFCARNDFFWEYSKKGVPFMKKESFDFNKILNHVSGKEVLGFSPFIDNENIAFASVDFDAHTSDKLTQEENEDLLNEAKEDSEKVYTFLKTLNLPVILNSSGSAGRHVRLLCYGANAKDMRIFMNYVLDQTLGNPDKHEIFPKQDNLNEDRKYGNQIKACFGKHQKKNKRSNIISQGKELDLFDSLDYVCKIIDNQQNYSPIIMSKEDYKKYEAQEKRIRVLKQYDSSGYNLNNVSNNVPKFCAVFEKILSKIPVPSKGRHTRHQCLDPNIASYGINHPSVRSRYQHVQERGSNTAIDNWQKYWVGGKPIFSCPQIIGFLKTYAKENDACAKGLSLCLDCPRFKKYINEKNSPKGFANSLIISEIAKKEGLEQCPKCNSNLIFKDNTGLFYCETCKKGGGMNLFREICLLMRNRKEAQQ
jgi:TOTE conflict system, Archaeo-Eukaryotic Primase domain